MALIVIQFVIQAFKIPTGSMEDSLLVGDFLLGLKFVYGSPVPFTHKKFPAMAEPEPGDVLIFRYPGDPDYPEYNPDRYKFVANLFLFGNLYWDTSPKKSQNKMVWYAPKDFIKRCVAKSGQSIKIRGKELTVDGKKYPLPPRGKFNPSRRGKPITDSLDYIMPKPGDTYRFDTLSLVEASWIRSLALQENPDKRVYLHLDLMVDSLLDNYKIFDELYFPMWEESQKLLFFMNQEFEQSMARQVPTFLSKNVAFQSIQRIARTGFVQLSEHPMYKKSGSKRTEVNEYFYGDLVQRLGHAVEDYGWREGVEVKVVPTLIIDGKRQTQYTIKEDCFFMMGDNRDNSSDSRFWGLLSRKNVKAKAFITYLSINNENDKLSLGNPFSWILLPRYIRWWRVGKLIE